MKNKNTFKKIERLSSKKDISFLIQKGEQIKTFPFFVRFYFPLISDSWAKILISVPKKKFKHAYQRNRIKRLIREAYRLNKHELIDCLKKNNKKILISFSYYNTLIPDFNLVQSKIISIISSICAKIENLS